MSKRALLLGYELDQPSFRHRMQSLVAPLQGEGWEVRLEQFPGGRYGLRTFERRAQLGWADVTVLHQIKLSAPEARLFTRFSRRNVFDFDDAIYVRRPRRLGEPPQDSIWRRRKFAATCAAVDAVVAGNRVLAAAARAPVAGRCARRVLVLPTSLDAYERGAGTLEPPRSAPPAAGAPIVLVWIGTPGNLAYLEILRPALASLTRRHPGLRLRVVCSEFPDWREVDIERVAWSAQSEAQWLASADIGVMPLTDDEWSRGKCAFKLLQYMAAGLPCVASPVGANAEAVIDSVNGYHASSTADWERQLERLIEQPALRAQFGLAGRARLAEHFSRRAYAEGYLNLLNSLRQ